MPSFDIVSKVIIHELNNAVDQANREIQTRFDFKGSNAQYKLNEETIELSAQNSFQIQQMRDILTTKLAKRNIDVRTLKYEEIAESNNEARQISKIQQGLDTELSKKIVKFIKETGAKVQASIQGDSVRVSGKKRDDLQEIISALREKNFEVALQYENFRE